MMTTRVLVAFICMLLIQMGESQQQAQADQFFNFTIQDYLNLAIQQAYTDSLNLVNKEYGYYLHGSSLKRS